MSQSLSKVLVHLIFSTKHREALIPEIIRPRLHGYIVGILDNLNSPSLQTGGIADHVHVLCALSRTISQAELVEQVKKSTSKWMKADGGVPGFSWQGGYGAFSIGESGVEKLIAYIQNQAQYHRKMTFQEEFRRVLAPWADGWLRLWRAPQPVPTPLLSPEDPCRQSVAWPQPSCSRTDCLPQIAKSQGQWMPPISSCNRAILVLQPVGRT